MWHVVSLISQWSSGKDSRAPGCPLSHGPKQLSMDLCVLSLALAATSQPDLAVLVDLVAWKASGPRLVSYQLGRTRGAVWSSVKRSWRDDPCHQTPVSPRCTEEPLVEPLRTAVSAEMAKSGHALHPAIYRSDEHPSWGWSWLRVGRVARQPGASTTLKPTSTVKRAVYDV